MIISAYQKRAVFYEKFLYLMRAKGYQIKGEILGNSSHKYNAFFPPDGERYIRGNEKSLGAEYTKERISERIAKMVQERKKPQVKDYAVRRFIDTPTGKFQRARDLNNGQRLKTSK